ncbi:MAG: hypothetical protein AB1730_20775 [Myxococcota bacterium]|jgi:hypothetical protein
MTTAAPHSVRNRSDAAQLRWHLLGRGISFHWEDNPASWVDQQGNPLLAPREAGEIRRLFCEVARLNDERCYDDALRLLKRASLGLAP